MYVFNQSYMGVWLKLIKMQNNYKIQKAYLVLSIAQTRTTFSPLPQVGLLRKPIESPLNGVAENASTKIEIFKVEYLRRKSL